MTDINSKKVTPPVENITMNDGVSLKRSEIQEATIIKINDEADSSKDVSQNNCTSTSEKQKAQAPAAFSISTHKPLFNFKPSILTQKAEEIRTDKAACSSNKNEKKSIFLDNCLSQTSTENIFKIQKVEKTNNFVFGENILSRVQEMKEFADYAKKTDSSEDKKQSEDSGPAKQGTEADVILGGEVSSTSDNEGLRRNAEEVQKHNTVQQLEETEVITGEENEYSVLRLCSCKLFKYNPERKEWVGKGFCNVHLNDTKRTPAMLTIKNCSVRPSRLVVRSMGGLQVVVNTPVWREMGLARVGEKSVRLSSAATAGIEGTSKVVQSWLLTLANQADADSLYDALEYRRLRLITNNEVLNTDENDDDEDDCVVTHVEPTRKRAHGSNDHTGLEDQEDDQNDEVKEEGGGEPKVKKSVQ